MKKLIYTVLIALSSISIINAQYINDFTSVVRDSLKIKKMSVKIAGNDEYKIVRPPVIPSSPQSQLFEKFVDQPVTEYNGIPDIRIPLYEIKIKGVTVPISLSYHAGGIRYRQPDGDVGVGWSLDAGGYRVSRTVYGREDDAYNMYDPNEYVKYQSGTERDSYLMKLGLNEIDPYLYIRERQPGIEFKEEDGEYDQFTYMLPSSNGHFIISDRKKGEVSIIEQNLDKIQLTVNSIRPNSLLDSIQITDTNGINYYLGGKRSSSEYLIENAQIAGFFGSRVGWPLKQINNQSNQNIYFNYKPYSTYMAKPRSLVVSDASQFYNLYGPCDMPRINGNIGLSDYPVGTVNYSEYVIDEIKGENEIVKFKRGVIGGGITIDEITITTLDGVVVKKIKFNYNETNNILWHILLKSIEVSIGSDIQQYQFQYYDAPSEAGLTYAMADQWGYYLKGSTGSDYPTLHNEFLDYFTFLEWHEYDGFKMERSLRKTDVFSYARFINNSDLTEVPNYFSLKKITYPTGGTVNYEYESNRNSDNKRTGGLRIKRVSHKTDSSLPLIKEYTYEGGQEKFQFEFNDFVEMKYYLSTTLCMGSFNRVQIFSMYPFLKELSNNCTQYKEVTVYENDKKNNDFRRITSTYNIPRQYELTRFSGGAVPDGGASVGAGLRTVSRYNLGLVPTINEQFIYDVNNNLKEKTSYTYKDTESKEYNNLKVIQRTYLTPNAANTKEVAPALFEDMGYKIYTGIRLLASIVKNSFDDNGKESIDSKVYLYNNKNQLLTKTEKMSKGDLVTNYKYPYDFQDAIYKIMVDNNIVAPIIEQYTTNNNAEIGRLKNTYRQDPIFTAGLIVPHEVFVSKSGINNLKRELSYDLYDKKGNLLQFTGLDGMVNSYLWSYNYQYPIAEIENNSYDNVKKNIGINLDVLSETMSPNMASIEKLKTNTVFLNSFISMYTYRPLTGLLSATSPEGIKTYYEYHNSYGALKEIKDHNGNLLSSYDYHRYPYEQIDVDLNVYAIYYINNLNLQTEFKAVTLGGSSNFTYIWSLKRGGTVISGTQNNNSFKALFTEEGQHTLTCIIKDNTTGSQVEQIKTFEVQYTEIQASIWPSISNEYYVPDPASFSIRATGGSGKFNYSWILKDASDNIVNSVTNQTVSTFTANFVKSGQHNLCCIVKDTKTGKTFETYKSINVSPLKLTIPTAGYYIMNDTPSFSIRVEKGSGSYSYKWDLKDSQSNTVLQESTNSIFKTNPLKNNRVTLGCTVKDLVKNETKRIEIQLSVYNQSIKLENITQRSDDMYAYTQGTIELNVPTKIKFNCTFRNSSIPASIEFRMGSNVFSTSDSYYTGYKEFTLSKGIHYISIQIYDSNATHSSQAEISIADADNSSVIEYPNTLSVSFNQ